MSAESKRPVDWAKMDAATGWAWYDAAVAERESLRLELAAERAAHAKDNEYLIRESRDVAVDAEAECDRLRGLLREAEAVCVMYHPDDTDATKHNLSVLRDRIAAALEVQDGR